MRSAMVWVFRVVWALSALVAGPAIGSALEDRSRSVQLLGTVGAWAVWALVLCASLVPTTVSLTVVRALAPGAPVAAVIAWTAGASGWEGPVAVGAGMAATAVAFGGELGEAFAQGSAYGHERRFPLRPPGPLLVLLPVLWCVAVAPVLTGAFLVAAGVWWAGVPLVAVGAVLGTLLARRLHRLSRRWLVIVPAGVVLHDHLLLAETLMTPVAQVAGASLAPVGTEALDLTGVSLGAVLEVRFREPVTVVAVGSRPGTTRAVHARSVLLGPTRPGRVLVALDATGVPVG